MTDEEDELFSYELRNELIDALEADPPPEEEDGYLLDKTTGKEYSTTQLLNDSHMLHAARNGHLMAQKTVGTWDERHLELVTMLVAKMEEISARKEASAEEE